MQSPRPNYSISKTKDELKSSFATQASTIDRHRLSSSNRGESAIELLAQRIEKRRENRIPTPHAIRKKILQDFYNISKREGYTDSNRVHYEDLLSLKAKTEDQVSTIPSFFRTLGFVDERELRLEIFERAERLIAESETEEDCWFYYRDFMFYYTYPVPFWPWLRNATSVAALFMFSFYFLTVIFFCNIVQDDNICPVDPTDKNRSYYGWLSALYFASTTMSTVGYGDLNVEKDPKTRTLYGACYMLFAILMAILFFGAVAESAFSRIKSPVRKFADRFFTELSHLIAGKPKNDELLYATIRRLRIQKLSEILINFCLLNVIGILSVRYFVNYHADEEGEYWDWMTSFYWAIQTTTTIGYGDLSMAFEMRWFQIFYLTMSTYLASNALGNLGSLSNDIVTARRRRAWERREVSKGMVNDFRTDEFGNNVDQFEFAIASLLLLGTITREDLEPIMDKFRVLAGQKGYINVLAETEVKEGDTVVAKLAERARSRQVHEEEMDVSSNSGGESHSRQAENKV